MTRSKPCRVCGEPTRSASGCCSRTSCCLRRHKRDYNARLYARRRRSVRSRGNVAPPAPDVIPPTDTATTQSTRTIARRANASQLLGAVRGCRVAIEGDLQTLNAFARRLIVIIQEAEKRLEIVVSALQGGVDESSETKRPGAADDDGLTATPTR